ncbi:hypothetical protein [Lutibacter sp.]|uniref:hypothetical protein n=1 Tax=Lutibacter sp. TaxID=1925666 RepID=UPI0034A0629A
MNTRISSKNNTFVFIKAYKEKWQLKNAIEIINENGISKSDLSVLLKISNQKNFDKKEMISFVEYLIGTNTAIGTFTNPEIGTILIGGSLTSLFLHKIQEKPLAEMTTGPYGILRGLGAPEKNTALYLKLLNEGYFLLIARGFENEFISVENLLLKLDN